MNTSVSDNDSGFTRLKTVKNKQTNKHTNKQENNSSETTLYTKYRLAFQVDLCCVL